MSITIDAFGMTDRGKRRELNQDNFLIVEINKSVSIHHSSLTPDAISGKLGSAGGHLFVVADGVGGGPEGERASEDAIRALLEYVARTVGCFNSLSPVNEDELFARLEKSVRGVHESLLETAGPGKQGPATTLTMVLLIWPRAYLVHVGDSRAYVRRNGKSQMLTRDQTLAEYMMNVGAWTEEQAASSRPGATLMSAVGGPNFEPVVGLVDLEPGDSIMLCTDGLTKHVSDERIASVLDQPEDAETMSRTLMNEALAGGGTDNVSVIVVRSS
ncbi:MAG TPA: protein phosphatase 2C domain-containing protein [Gemmatimonadaceae bacterium]|nr:protein phosphatase 2C domain-containing protein [Gemmatimonadaceae bacterium]